MCHGTSIVIRKKGEEIAVVADSKRKGGGEIGAREITACKVISLPNGVFVAAGQPIYSRFEEHGGKETVVYDTSVLGPMAAKGVLDAPSMINRFTELVTPGLRAFMGDAYSNNSDGQFSDMLYQRSPIVEIAYVVTLNHIASFKMRAFFGNVQPGPAPGTINVAIGPSDWTSEEYTVLGVRQVQGYLLDTPNMFDRPPMEFAEFLVRRAVKDFPRSVGEPLTLVTIDGSGPHWDPGNVGACEDQANKYPGQKRQRVVPHKNPQK